MAQAGVIRDFMVALGFKTDNAGLKQMQDAMGGVELKAVALKGALLALATGAVAAVRQTAGELDKLYFSSQRIGASVTNINAYGNAIAQLGGSAEGAVGSLESLAEKMRNSPGYEGMINSLGVQTKDANGAVRDRVEVMKDLSGVLSKMPAYQANAYASSLGIDQNTLLAMRDGKFVSNMDKYQKIQKELGMNDDLAKSGNEFMTEYRDLTMMTKTGFQVIVMQAGKALIPVLRLLNQLIRAGITTFSQLNPQIKEGLTVGLRFGMLSVVLLGFIKVLGILLKFIPTLKTLISLLKIMRMLFLASPIGIVLALAAAIGLLWDDYRTWQEGGKSFLDWEKWTQEADWVIEKIQELMKWIQDLTKLVLDWGFGEGTYEAAVDFTSRKIIEPFMNNFNKERGIPNPGEEGGNAGSAKAVTPSELGKNAAIGIAKIMNDGAKEVISSTTKPFKTAMTEFKGGVIEGFTPEQTLAFANRVMFRENKSGKTDVVNKWGYTGKYQFGASALADTGFIDKSKLKKASRGVKNGSDAKAHRAFLADKSNWLIGDWEQYKQSHEMQDLSFKRLVEANLSRGSKVHKNEVKKMMGFAMAAHLKGAGPAGDWYRRGIDSKDGNGTKTSDYAKFGEDALKWVQPTTIKTSSLSNTRASNIQSYAPPQGNPHKNQINSSASNMSASNVTIHQSFKTDMTLNGVSSPVESANAVKRQQENSMMMAARGAKSLIG